MVKHAGIRIVAPYDFVVVVGSTVKLVVYVLVYSMGHSVYWILETFAALVTFGVESAV